MPRILSTDIRPILSEYCLKCHSTEKQKGDLDLEQFTSVPEVKRHPEVWTDVLEQLGQQGNAAQGKAANVPTRSKERRLTGWAEATLDEVALASAGDPGPVVLRRLSNAEYTYTVRDLTGVETLNPAKEFPVDGAAGEGFDNAGAALVMSPALLGKYLDAAKELASHAVLLPDGIRFSAATTSRDWTDEILAKIRAFHASFCESGGAMTVNLQAIAFDTNDSGRLPVERLYHGPAPASRRPTKWGGQHRRGRRDGRRVNPKYLTLLWQALNDSRPLASVG